MKGLKNNGMCILNDDIKRDHQRSYTFIGHDETVIDYAIVNVRQGIEYKNSRLKK